MCWQQLTHFGSWLNDFWTTVSMSFPIDTSANNKVWIVLETHEWPSQVTKLCPITIHAKSNSHLLMKKLFNDIWENFSCLFSLFRHLYKYLCNFHVKSLHPYTAMWLHLLEINSSSVHMYICVCFIRNYPIFNKVSLWYCRRLREVSLLGIIAKYGSPIREWALLYQAFFEVSVK